MIGAVIGNACVEMFAEKALLIASAILAVAFVMMFVDGEKEQCKIKQIAYIRSDFVEKFGIPRQSNLADTRAEIHFLPEYQNADALREIEAYDYLWLIWEFSESIRDTWSPTVRPPRWW